MGPPDQSVCRGPFGHWLAWPGSSVPTLTLVMHSAGPGRASRTLTWSPGPVTGI